MREAADAPEPVEETPARQVVAAEPSPEPTQPSPSPATASPAAPQESVLPTPALLPIAGPAIGSSAKSGFTSMHMMVFSVLIAVAAAVTAAGARR
ncbi:hypothetical protein [Salinactinospora qingdaonensis]|uniref:Uncharacterized protein n=1 Tax=Salinactinospora qingdaonensis TaxID=702744 RepID=A0ABP7GCN1_9ACTN